MDELYLDLDVDIEVDRSDYVQVKHKAHLAVDDFLAEHRGTV